jgi:predicted enzyme related to lactoylglutathione lyase
MMDPLALSQINIVVSDMPRTLDFYRRFGWTIETPTHEHAVATLPNGMSVDFDSHGFVPVWDSGYQGGTGGTTVLGIRVKTRASVDELYADLVAAGHHGRQPPYDAFWGSRYAIVEDPDGNPVGLMSPSDDALRTWPPNSPPTS